MSAMQAKDVPERPILEWLAAQTRWACWYDLTPGADSMPSVIVAMPPDTPEKVRLAKMRALIQRGLVDGCGCGCRGDFVITEKGRALLSEPARLTGGKEP